MDAGLVFWRRESRLRNGEVEAKGRKREPKGWKNECCRVAAQGTGMMGAGGQSSVEAFPSDQWPLQHLAQGRIGCGALVGLPFPADTARER